MGFNLRYCNITDYKYIMRLILFEGFIFWKKYEKTAVFQAAKARLGIPHRWIWLDWGLRGKASSFD